MAIQFPNNPGIGSVFTDTDAGFSYEWTGVVWKSFTPAAANNIKELDDISSGFDNSTTTFDLTIDGVAYVPTNAAMLQISLGGIIQEPTTDYTVSTSTITFTTAPNSGLDFFGVVRGTAVAIDYANDGNVQTKQEFTATEGQTSFTVTGGYTSGYVDVFRNGIRLGSDDFTDTSGTAIVLTVPAQADDLIEVVKYNIASLVISEGQFSNLNVTGIITGGSFSGDGSGLTGVASTDNIITATPVNVLNNVRITGFTTAGAVSASNLNVSGVSTFTGDSTFSGNLTGDAATFSGNVTIGGTLTYQDVTNIDSVGIITAQQGIQVLANGLNVVGVSTLAAATFSGVSTFAGNVDISALYIESVSSSRLNFTDSGSGGFIKRDTGEIIVGANDISLRDGAASEYYLRATQNGSVELRYDNTTRLETADGGVAITGVCTATSFSGNGSALTGISSWEVFDTWLYGGG